MTARNDDSLPLTSSSGRSMVSTFVGAVTLALLSSLIWGRTISALDAAVDTSPTPDQDQDQQVDFDTDIVAILSKAGCNAAECHGGAAGRGGFRLSLFGGDAAFDYRSIVRDLKGRRIDLARPARSLFLRKPTLDLEHGGDQRFAADSPQAEMIRHWIAQGAKRKLSRHLVALAVAPELIAVPAGDARPAVPLRVVASFDDGVERDVTALAVYAVSNDGALQVSSEGIVSVQGAGRHNVFVRFLSQVVAVAVTSPFPASPSLTTGEPRPAVAAADVTGITQPSRSWIDEQIELVLQQLDLAPGPPANDATFLRRLMLDLTGRLPTREQLQAFAADSDRDKRASWIDRLLASEEFVDYWTFRFKDWLRFRTPGDDRIAAVTFHDWLKQQVRTDAGWDQIAREMVTAEGDTHQVGAAVFHRLTNDPYQAAEHLTEVLMGVRLRCANCHNHPLDRWTQDDYHGLAQLLCRVDRSRVVGQLNHGEIVHPRTGKAAAALLPTGIPAGHEARHRKQLAAWLTAAENPYFSRAMVGRVWQGLMGRGLIDPPDDLRVTNPPTHPELMDRLTDYFVAHHFRLRPLIREICRSQAYQRATEQSLPDATSPAVVYYGRGAPRTLDARVLLDCIADVTLVPFEFEAERANRVTELVDLANARDLLMPLYNCPDPHDCSTGNASPQRGLAAELHLLNGKLLNDRIEAPGGRLVQRLEANAATSDVVREFYEVALSRAPTAAELEFWTREIDHDDIVDAAVERPLEPHRSAPPDDSAPQVAHARRGDDAARRARFVDFVWALLNCREFSCR